MNRFAQSSSLRAAVAALVLAISSGMASADTTLAVSIDTSNFGQASGWLDLQFNGAGDSESPAATVTLTNFSGFDALAAVETAGQVSGSLATGYVIGNGDSFNDLFHAVGYGSVLSFNITFSGDANLSVDIGQSVFSVSAFGADKTTLLGGSSSPDGSLASVTWTPATTVGGFGTTDVATFSNAATISAVPEPSSWLMLGIGGMLLAGVARARRA
ncbi:NF038129 family PEP-CTERM protein [Pseudoduganella buxea]|uniref:PEP-CTERM sorting domain-containing protein n=1 Tax=Pseudoduganella buxea TaxID=1949069 RepID=A0A6I3SU27_9BURK|nr:NF038129 family PEP-CTERM protein [Pseudoduganella buxea]MTV52673.1 PEP-CTERM sorting domain-containing protein [Pseudoduganella buxea]GGC02649.1 hypothetical protein GCM10011572_25740 [Pseudoduganella buxea]